MHIRYRRRLPAWWCRACTPLLALSWLLGLALGTYAAFSAGTTYFPLMRMAASSPVSIVGLLSSILLPFLLSAFAVFLREPRLLLPIAFFKALSCGFCVFSAARAYGSAGWLVTPLLLFSDFCLMPVLFRFWLRHISGDEKPVIQDICICFILCGAVGSIDFCLISPFLVNIINP